MWEQLYVIPLVFVLIGVAAWDWHLSAPGSDRARHKEFAYYAGVIIGVVLYPTFMFWKLGALSGTSAGTLFAGATFVVLWLFLLRYAADVHRQDKKVPFRKGYNLADHISQMPEQFGNKFRTWKQGRKQKQRRALVSTKSEL